MSSSSTRGAIILAGLAAVALAACGGSAIESPASPGVAIDDVTTFTALGYGPGNGGQNTLAGDGTCDGTGYGPGDGTCDGTCDGTAVGPDPDDLQTLLVEALQEEHKAEQTYRRVLTRYGQVMPFATIADSEQQHVQALLRLFARREWTAPPSVWTLGNVAVFDSLAAACAGGIAVEIEDAALYDGYLSRNDLPRDVVNVFTNLRWASLERHLPAFQACR